MKRTCLLVAMFLALALSAMPAAAQCVYDPDNPCFDDGTGSGDGYCHICGALQNPDGTESNQLVCQHLDQTATSSAWSVVQGYTVCTVHNVAVGPGYCSLSGSKCAGYLNYVSKGATLTVSWAFRSKAVADFMGHYPGVTEADLAEIATSVATATVGKTGVAAARTQYDVYFAAAAQRGISFQYGGIPVWPEPRLPHRIPHVNIAALTPAPPF